VPIRGKFTDFERLTAAAAERFLTDLANPVRHEPKAGQRFLARYGHILRDQISIGTLTQVYINVEGEPADVSEDELLRTYWLLPVRDAVRLVWKEPDLKRKQHGVYKILGCMEHDIWATSIWPILHFEEIFASSTAAPDLLEQALLFLTESADRARYCANPDCRVLPYFFAARRSQKYCSETCSKPAQQLAKRNWWREHGPEWRKARAAGKRKRG
jgi:hypothetical protein